MTLSVPYLVERENLVDNEVQLALAAFTDLYCEAWRQKAGTGPQSEALYGVPSPCVVATRGETVEWQPQRFSSSATLEAVERALEIQIQPAAHAFYALQLAGDMPARFNDLTLTLLQAWSEDDFQRVQENLIGHLVMQKRLKLSPTVFLATLDDEMEVVSLCNLTGEVVRERVGTRQRSVLSPNLAAFLQALTPDV